MTNEKKVALVTGAAHRLGKSIAIELHARNIDIAIHCGQSYDAAQLLCKQLNALRTNSAAVFPCDLAEPSTAKKLIEQAIRHFKRLDYLVNNASIFYPTPFAQTNSHELKRFLTINFSQPVKLLQSAYPHLKSNSGAAVNLIDIYAKRGLANYCDYVTSKNSLLEATKELATCFSPEVRVNGVSPGAILWPDVSSNNETEQNSQQQNIIRNTALGRQGCAQDISKTVAYLLIDATYTTGSVINVDGGRNLYI